MYDILTEIKLYPVRVVAIEDMKLKINVIKMGENFNEIGYEERCQSSKRCPNNDRDMNEIERLNKKIKMMEIGNRRVDNAINMLSGREYEVINRLFLKKQSKTEVSKVMDRSQRQINRLLNKAIQTIEFNLKGECLKNVPKMS